MDYEDLENLAVEKALKGDWESAIEINNKLLKMGHKTPAVYNRLGKAYSELGNWQKAIECFSNALKLDPLSSVAQRGLERAKINKKAGINTQKFNKDILLHDSTSSKIIKIKLRNKEINDDHTFKIIKGGEDFYLLVDVNQNRPIRRISRKYLGLRQDFDPQELSVDILNYEDGVLELKINSSEPVFKAEKQEIEPELKLDEKEIEEEKRQIQEMFEEIEEENY